MKQGEIIIIPFPFTSLTDGKVRPALVISNTRFNKGKNVVVLAISTQKNENNYSESLVQKDLNKGKILKKSFIRFSNILSLEKSLIIKKVGELNNDKTKKVINSFIKFFNEKANN